MSEMPLLQIIEDAMDKHGADGLWNGNGPCGCGIGHISPGDCLSVDCMLAKSKIAEEDDVDGCIEIGDAVYFPIQIKAANKGDKL